MNLAITNILLNMVDMPTGNLPLIISLVHTHNTLPHKLLEKRLKFHREGMVEIDGKGTGMETDEDGKVRGDIF